MIQQVISNIRYRLTTLPKMMKLMLVALMCSMILSSLSLQHLMKSQQLLRASLSQFLPSTQSLHISDSSSSSGGITSSSNLLDTSLALSSDGFLGIDFGPTQIIGILLLSTIPLAIIFISLQSKKRREEEEEAYNQAELRSRQMREEKEYATILQMRKKEMEIQQKETLAKELQEESNRRLLMEAAEKAKKDEERKRLEESRAKFEAEKKELERIESLRLLKQKQDEELQIKLENEKKAEYEDMMRRAEVAKSRREQEEAAERDWKIKQAAIKEAAAAKAWKSKQLAAKASVVDKQARLANAEIALAKEKALTMKLLAIEQEKKIELEEASKKESLQKQRLFEEEAAAKLWRDKQLEKSNIIAAKYSKLTDKITASSSAQSESIKSEDFMIPTAPTTVPKAIETAPTNNIPTPIVPVAAGTVTENKDPVPGSADDVVTIPSTKSGLSLDDSLASFNDIKIDDKTRNEIDKKLNEALTILAKVAASRLRSFINQYKPDLVKGQESLDFEQTVKLAAEAGWSRSNGDFNTFVSFLDNEFKVDVTESVKWMRISVANANELTESRLKELIVVHGGRDVNPVKRKGEKLSKSDYISSLLEVLRYKFKNDYREVAMLLGNEKSVVKTSKGFGSKK